MPDSISLKSLPGKIDIDGPYVPAFSIVFPTQSLTLEYGHQIHQKGTPDHAENPQCSKYANHSQPQDRFVHFPSSPYQAKT